MATKASPTPAGTGAPCTAALAEAALDYWTNRYAQAVVAEHTGGRTFVLVHLGGERFAIALEDLDEVAYTRPRSSI